SDKNKTEFAADGVPGSGQPGSKKGGTAQPDSRQLGTEKKKHGRKRKTVVVDVQQLQQQLQSPNQKPASSAAAALFGQARMQAADKAPVSPRR
ncbi:hypothetical protein, partial [Klebsiella pneumoniae]|uniref:hypothetical protein n=1 Tax=Klebsiella pneumoniae TaxID=573 RepID=UPI003012B3C6